MRWQLAELDLTLTERTAPASFELIDYVTEAQRVAGTSEAFLVAFITHQRDRTNVYLYDPKGPHLYAREVAVSESPAAASEELAIILRSAIQARIDGGDLAMAEIALPKPAVPKRPTTPRVWTPPTGKVVTIPRELRGAAGLSGVTSRPLSDADWQEGLVLRAWAQARPIRFGLSYSIFPGLSVSSDLAEITIYRHPIEAFVGVRIGTGAVNVLAESAFCADPIRRETALAQPPLTGQPPNWRWLWSVSARLRFETRLFSPVWFTAAAGAEFPLNPYAFELAVAEQRQRLARILSVRPTFEMGLVVGWR